MGSVTSFAAPGLRMSSFTSLMAITKRERQLARSSAWDAYVRVSRVNGRAGDSFISPDVQRSKVEAWAKSREVEIACVHQDLDQTGGKLSRPGFDKALDRVRQGKTAGIVVAKLDRFSRAGVADALRLIEEIIEAGGQVAAVEEGVDPTTPTGEFTMTLFLALARMQRQQIGETWNTSRELAVARGIHVSSKPPTGYDRDDETKRLVPNDDAPHVAEVFRMKAAGSSWRDLGDYLTANGVRTPYGLQYWVGRSLSHVIANRAYLGEARSGEYVNPEAHEQIVDPETWERAQRAIGDRPVNGMGGALLAGILRCEACGYVLKPDTMRDRSGEKLRLYRCRGHRPGGSCPAPASVLGRVVEPWTVEQMFLWLGGVRARGSALTSDLRAAELSLSKAKRELATYITAVSAEDVGAEAFAAGAKQRREAVDAAAAFEDEVRERAGLTDLPQEADLRQQWPELDVGEQNAILRAALDAVILSNGRGRQIDQRARLVWRGSAETVKRPDLRRKKPRHG
jgi:site-specific DNA recombinase